MKKILMLFLLFPICASAQSDRISLFTTSVDWEAVTGLRFSEYRLQFSRDKTIGKTGMELYFLDAFPCFVQAQTARVWVSPSNLSAIDKDARMTITCLYPPESVRFAYREAASGAIQNKTTGIMTCNIARGSNTVNLAGCARGADWTDIKK